MYKLGGVSVGRVFMGMCEIHVLYNNLQYLHAIIRRMYQNNKTNYIHGGGKSQIAHHILHVNKNYVVMVRVPCSLFLSS